MVGAIYEGQFENGVKDGWGRLIQSNGCYYIGYFQDDMFNGPGRLAVCNLGLNVIQEYKKKSIDEIKEAYPGNLKSNYTFKEGEFLLGSLQSSQIDYYNMCYDRILQAQELKKKHEDKICNTSKETMIEEIRGKLVARGEKAFTTLIRQFQSTVIGSN